MIINGMNYLLFERRGCGFWKDEPRRGESDIGNYRITTPGEIVPLKDGRKMLFEFGMYDRYEMRTTNKRTGQPLKNPVRELRMTAAAHMGTEYSDERGSWRDIKMEREFYKKPMKYTEKNILRYINRISAEKYDAIKYVYALEMQVKPDENFTPRQKIAEFLNGNRIKYDNNKYGELIARLYDGDYKYMSYELDRMTDKLKIYLEKIA